MCEVIFYWDSNPDSVAALPDLHNTSVYPASLSLFYLFSFPNIRHLPSAQPLLRPHSVLAPRCVDLWYKYIYIELRPRGHKSNISSTRSYICPINPTFLGVLTSPLLLSLSPVCLLEIKPRSIWNMFRKCKSYFCRGFKCALLSGVI